MALAINSRLAIRFSMLLIALVTQQATFKAGAAQGPTRGSAPEITAGQPDLWVAFRYDRDRVLFYADKLVDPIKQDYSKPLEAPVAGYGAGGYLLPLTVERLRTFDNRDVRPPGEPTAGSRVTPGLGRQLVLMLGGDATVVSTTEAYVEQWGSENPLVGVGVLARIAPADLAAYRGASSSYFLVSTTRAPASPAIARESEAIGQDQIINRFGRLGVLMLRVSPAGWTVTLHVADRDTLRPTAVAYHYGD